MPTYRTVNGTPRPSPWEARVRTADGVRHQIGFFATRELAESAEATFRATHPTRPSGSPKRHAPNERAEARRESARRYANSSKGAAAVARHRHRNPDKERARRLLNHAVAEGRVVKPGHCVRCARPAQGRNLHAHHADYAKPLDVEWLCRWCHQEEHK